MRNKEREIGVNNSSPWDVIKWNGFRRNAGYNMISTPPDDLGNSSSQGIASSSSLRCLFQSSRARSTALQEVLCAPGGPATVFRVPERRPVALRPTLSSGLPFSGVGFCSQKGSVADLSRGLHGEPTLGNRVFVRVLGRTGCAALRAG